VGRDPLWKQPASYLNDAAFKAGLAVLAEFDLVFDLLVLKEQIPAATQLASSLPEIRFNLNHLGYPAIGNSSAMAAWTKDITALGPYGRMGLVCCCLWCKVSEP